jgi:hypothetical protein
MFGFRTTPVIHIVAGAYKPVRAKHSRFAAVQNSFAILADSEFSRHKDVQGVSVHQRCNRVIPFERR